MAELQELADWKAMLVPRKQENQTMQYIRWAGASICGAIRNLPDGDPRVACQMGLWHLGVAYDHERAAPTTGEGDET